MRINHAKLASTLLATTAFGLGAIEIDANIAARADLRHVLARNPGLAVASIFAEPLTGRLTLHDIRIGTGDRRLAINTLNLPLPRQHFTTLNFAGTVFGLVTPAVASPFDDKPEEAKPEDTKPEEPQPNEAAPEAAAPKAEAPATAAPAVTAEPTTTAGGNGTAAADNITFTNGTTTYRIKHIDVAGTPLSSADLVALFDAKSTQSLEARFKTLTATAIVVPEIEADDATAGSERHATISQMLLSGVTGGKIAAGSIAGVTFTTKTGTDDVSGSVGPIQMSGLDLPQITHVFNSVRSDEAEPILPLYESITVNAVKVTDAKKSTTFTLTTLRESGVKARPLKTDFLASKKPGTETLSDADRAAVFDDMSHSFEIGAIEATDLSGQSPGNQGLLTLASVSLHDFGKNKLGGFGLRALRFEGGDTKLAIDSIDFGPFVLPPPKTAGASNTDMMPPTAKVDVNHILFDGKGDGADASGTPMRVKFDVAHAGFTSDGAPGDLPRTAKLTIDNVVFDIPPVSGQAQPLYDMGYRHMDMSLGLATIYDPQAQSLMIHDLTVNGASMGSLALGLHLVNVTKGLVSSNPEVAKASALAILAKGIAVDVVNNGIVEKAIAWKAGQDGMDVAKEKEFLVDFFGTKLPASVNNSANAKIVGGAIAQFVAAPKNLHISIESKSGLGVGSMALLADPGLLIDTLDVKASANQ